MKDWRGTEIEVGSTIVWHYNAGWGRGDGRVIELQPKFHGDWGHLVVEWIDHSGHSNKRSKPLDSSNVTVLTKDMFDD